MEPDNGDTWYSADGTVILVRKPSLIKVTCYTWKYLGGKWHYVKLTLN